MKTMRHLSVGVLLVMAGVAVGVRYGARFRELIRLARGNECFRTERYERMVRNHVRMDAQIEDEVVYYLGDSHIYGYFAGGGVCKLWNWKRYDRRLACSLAIVPFDQQWDKVRD